MFCNQCGQANSNDANFCSGCGAKLVKQNAQAQLKQQPEKLWSLSLMEDTGGEPDVVLFETGNTEIVFYDCALETPKGRRSLCYDREALDARKENKPLANVIDIAQSMGVQLLTEQQYRYLQTIFNFDLKTSSWVETPEAIRKQGGALFCDFRYGQVFLVRPV